jgi:hypothetical protein
MAIRQRPEGRTPEGLEEYAQSLDLKPEEVIALLDAALAEENPTTG